MNTKRIKILRIMVGLLTFMGLSVWVFPMIASLKPREGAEQKWFHELDVSNLAMGHLRNFKFGDDSYWVYRRTELDKLDLKKRKASAQSEISAYFVFRNYEREGTTYVVERNTIHSCGTWQYYAVTALPDGTVLYSRFICRDDHSKPMDAYAMFVYDTAGFPFRSWMNRLEVKEYTLNRKGSINISWY